MLTRRIGLVALVLAAAGSTGCFRNARAVEATFGLAAAIIQVAAAAASDSGGSRHTWTDHGKDHPQRDDCCYSRENPTPVDGPVDRPISECEIARGRWREAHQDQDEVPAELRCLDDGSYPAVSMSPAPSPLPAATVEIPLEAQEQAPPPSQAAAQGDTI